MFGRETFIGAAASAAVILGVSAVASAAYMEDFNAIPDATALTAVPGWTMANTPTAPWYVESQAGYGGSGAGIRLATADAAIRTLSGADICTDADPSFEAQIMLTPGTEHRYFNPFLWVSGAGAVSGRYGVGIRFAGGSSVVAAGATGGSIQYMSGGTDWHNTTLPSIASSAWKAQVWYTVRFDNIATSPTVSVFESDAPSNVVLDGVAIGTFGAGTYSRIDQVGLRETSTVRNTRYDNFQVVVPEPATAGLSAIVGLGALARRRRA